MVCLKKGTWGFVPVVMLMNVMDPVRVCCISLQSAAVGFHKYSLFPRHRDNHTEAQLTYQQLWKKWFAKKCRAGNGIRNQDLMIKENYFCRFSFLTNDIFIYFINKEKKNIYHKLIVFNNFPKSDPVTNISRSTFLQISIYVVITVQNLSRWHARSVLCCPHLQLWKGTQISAFQYHSRPKFKFFVLGIDSHGVIMHRLPGLGIGYCIRGVICYGHCINYC